MGLKGDYWDHAAPGPEHRLVTLVPGGRTAENTEVLVGVSAAGFGRNE